LTPKHGTKGEEAMFQKAFSRMQPRTWSLFFNLSCLSNGYDIFSVQKLGKGIELKSKDDSTDDTKRIEIVGNLPGFARRFDYFEAILIGEFSGDLPIAKVNSFKVFDRCMEVWNMIIRELDKKEPEGEPFVHNHVFLYTIKVDAFIEYHRHRKIPPDVSGHREMKIMGDAIVKAWGGKTSKDFVWMGV
jgi:hypothetical protein